MLIGGKYEFILIFIRFWRFEFVICYQHIFIISNNSNIEMAVFALPFTKIRQGWYGITK